MNMEHLNVKLSCAIVLISLMFGPALTAQNVISSINGSLETEEFILDWTIGEPVTAALNSTDLFLVQGYHQPVLVCDPCDDQEQPQPELLVEETPTLDVKFEAKLFPNPSIDQLHVEMTIPKEGVWNIAIYNSSGQLLRLEKQAFSVDQKLLRTFEVSNLKSGQYFLRISNQEYSQTNRFHVFH